MSYNSNKRPRLLHPVLALLGHTVAQHLPSVYSHESLLQLCVHTLQIVLIPLNVSA